MRTLVHAGALCLAILGMRVSDVEISDIGIVSPAHAQAVPKTLEALKQLNSQTSNAAASNGSGEFEAFLKTTGSGGGNLSQQQREASFHQFLEWRDSQPARRR
jgi:hypothetical protein